MSKSIKGQVVLITGASSGFGADAARLFAKEGCIVILAARRMERLVALVEEIRAAGGKALPVRADVTEQSQIDDLVQTSLDAYQRIDILFNNAGFGRPDWLECLDPVQDINAQIDINLRGLIQVTRAVLPGMLAQGSGHVINMASMAGRIAAPLYSVYAATKFGVRGFNDALRREVAPFGIHVSALYPGGAETEFNQHAGISAAKKSVSFLSSLNMTSEYVARKVVNIAKHPRRLVVLPWWFQPLESFDTFFPGAVDWLLKVLFVKPRHRPAPAAPKPLDPEDA